MACTLLVLALCRCLRVVGSLLALHGLSTCVPSLVLVVVNWQPAGRCCWLQQGDRLAILGWGWGLLLCRQCTTRAHDNWLRCRVGRTVVSTGRGRGAKKFRDHTKPETRAPRIRRQRSSYFNTCLCF